jgi:hypothetical protein
MHAPIAAKPPNASALFELCVNSNNRRLILSSHSFAAASDDISATAVDSWRQRLGSAHWNEGRRTHIASKLPRSRLAGVLVLALEVCEDSIRLGRQRGRHYPADEEQFVLGKPRVGRVTWRSARFCFVRVYISCLRLVPGSDGIDVREYCVRKLHRLDEVWTTVHPAPSLLSSLNGKI